MTVEFVFDFMDLAIANGQSLGRSPSEQLRASAIVHAKKAYRDALVLAGRLSLNARQVAEFEWRSVQIERLISRLQTQYNEASQLESTR